MRRSNRSPLLRGRLLKSTALALGIAACSEPPTQSPPAPEAEAAVGTEHKPLTFRQVSGGYYHTCGVTTDNVAYCWGLNMLGQLGNGTNTGPELCDDLPCSTRPVRVLGGLSFRQVHTGENHFTCGVTTDDVAYCWGFNANGELGTGSNQGPELCEALGDESPCSRTPVRVVGGLPFRRLNTGLTHTCGITTAKVAYCWGANSAGELGNGTTNGSARPVRVAGGLAFRHLTASEGYTCGVTTGRAAYCWGLNSEGQLGVGTRTGPETCTGDIPCSTRPIRVLGGLAFRQVNAGDFHTCGATTGNVAYCWGRNQEGQLGDGTTNRRLTPRRVAAGLAFTSVNAGVFHSCGLTGGGAAYCWGNNTFGELGDGTNTRRLTPRAVAGGLAFRLVNSEGFYTCGVTTGSVGYCWGLNHFGQLGNGTRTNRNRPVAVVSPAP